MKAIILQPDGNMTMSIDKTRNRVHCLPERITVKTKAQPVANKKSNLVLKINY
jgi:hypothetical protein